MSKQKKILTSERLFLREFEKQDLNLLYYLDSDPEIMEYIGLPKTLQESVDRYQKAQLKYQCGDGLGKWMAVEKETGKSIGWFVLNNLDNSELIEVGYRLHQSFWGKGYATEMTVELVKYGFQQLGLDRIAGVTHQENEASKKVLVKAGLKYIGIRHYYNLDVTYFEIDKSSFHKLNRNA